LDGALAGQESRTALNVATRKAAGGDSDNAKDSWKLFIILLS
jgi:hypothetical protein